MKIYKSSIRRKRKRQLYYLIPAMVLWGFISWQINFSLIRLWRGIPHMFNLIGRMLQPDFSYILQVLPRLMETIEMAAVSSTLGVILGSLGALFVARNTAIHPIIPLLGNPFFTFLRTIPNLIWAAILVSIFSVGKFPGMIALTITATLITVKLLREYIETIPESVIKGVESVGATKIQTLRYGVLPMVFQQMAAVFFLVLEVNIRGATILGLVGAGGIGQILWRDLNHLRYDNLATLIILLFATILVIDLGSLWLRKGLKDLYIPAKTIPIFRLRQKVKWIVVFLLLIVGMTWLVNSLDITAERMILGLESGARMVLRMAQFEFSYAPRLVEGLMESLFIALFATVTGGVGALFLSYLTAYNTSPYPEVALFFKAVVNLLRTFPPIVVAIIFFRGVGPGPLAGAMALSIYTLGVMTKLYSEVIESTGENIQQGILITGAGKILSYRFGIVPHTFSNYISLLLYRFESNMRNSTILGVIGAGGIGTILANNIAWRNWERVGLLLAGVAILMMAVEKLSEKIRKKLV